MLLDDAKLHGYEKPVPWCSIASRWPSQQQRAPLAHSLSRMDVANSGDVNPRVNAVNTALFDRTRGIHDLPPRTSCRRGGKSEIVRSSSLNVTKRCGFRPDELRDQSRSQKHSSGRIDTTSWCRWELFFWCLRELAQRSSLSAEAHHTVQQTFNPFVARPRTARAAPRPRARINRALVKAALCSLECIALKHLQRG